ncbi:MAG: hypothetical protein LBG69_06040 [Zoogloeaceae bacterium]|jgi:sarcosine oxidase subunit gamma|nr:hypothetical protein [Zoogloeaceae bacterium]
MNTFFHAAAPKEAARFSSALTLEDLTNVPRVGIRGKAAADYLKTAGFALPETANRLCRAETGALTLRLSASEYLLLGLDADGARVQALEASLPNTGEGGLYALPRRDSHVWFRISGARRHEAMAKLCGVDLSPGAFARDALAQTSVAAVSAIVAGDGGGECVGAFHLLVDSAFAAYFQASLLDALTEFHGC